MSDIITLDKEANERCMSEINVVLKKYGRVLSPKVLFSLAGMSFTVEVMAAQLVAPTPGDLGGAKDA